MIILVLLALGANAWTTDNRQESVTEIRQQWEESETVFASGDTTGSKAIDTTAAYNTLHSGKTWGQIVWKVEVSVKRNDAGTAHVVTVTIPNATPYPNAGAALVTACNGEATYGTACVAEAWAVIAPQGTLTVTFAKAAGVACTVKIKITGINTGRTFVDNASWHRTILGKRYNYAGWPNWKIAREKCAAQKATTNLEMCLTSEHSDFERDVVSGLINTKGWPGAWIGQTEAVGLGKWVDVNSLGWRWSDGSTSTYITPWTITPPTGTYWEGVQTNVVNAVTEGRSRANRVVSFAGSEYLTVSHCGAQLANKQWSGMKCNFRWPAVCAPCMSSGSKRLQETSVCEECRLPFDTTKPAGPNNPARCYSEEYCRAERAAYVFPVVEDVTDWGKIVGITLGVIIPLTCIGYCCFYEGKKDDVLDDEPEE